MSFSSLIGGHVSVAGGIEKSVERAVKEGFDGMQVFVSPPRSFKPNIYSPEQIDSFRLQYDLANMRFLVQHAIYLLNLSARDEDLWRASIDSIVGYMLLGDQMGSVGTVVHVGSKMGDESLVRAAEGIREILAQTPESQCFIIENAASRARIGGEVLDIIRLYELVNNTRLKVCLDTQHIFAAGLELANATVCGRWIEQFDNEIGSDQIVCLHVNDSKTGCGSGADRHENILVGKIGEAGFKNFLLHPKMKNIPIILEVPGSDPKHKGPDRENKERLEELLRI
ncbi:MAG: putative endonuclease 4 [Microgenomates bacterium OLB22]|nr:MAG: putative endonuclease 4 [Microgenomates bacterium OLB22]